MNTRPYTEAHAIARLEFAIIYRDEFEHGFIEKLRPFLVEQLPNFVLATDSSDSDDNAVLTFEKRGEDGEITEEVHIHGNYAHAVWSDYRGWTFSRDWSTSKLAKIIEFSGQVGLLPHHLGLTYRDVFFNDDPDSYSPNDVLRSDCRFLPQVAFSFGKQWRNWIGWPESAVDELLNISSTLGIDAKLMTFEEDDPVSRTHVTEIVHRQQLGLRDTNGHKWTPEFLISAWDVAHRRNVALIKELLTEQMLAKIGLKESER